MAVYTTLVWKGEAAKRKITVGAVRGLDKTARLIRDEALRLILHTPKTGRMYGTHQASAPGEAPASETGRLISNFSIKKTGFKVEVTNTDPKAALLELGTRRMRPRPFLAPATFNMAKATVQTIGEEIRKETGYTGSKK